MSSYYIEDIADNFGLSFIPVDLAARFIAYEQFHYGVFTLNGFDAEDECLFEDEKLKSALLPHISKINNAILSSIERGDISVLSATRELSTGLFDISSASISTHELFKFIDIFGMSDCVGNEGYPLADYVDKLADMHNYVSEMVRKFKGLSSLKHAPSIYNAEDLLNDPVAINLIQLENFELKMKLEKLELNQNNVKPLAPMERDTLLIIIAALAKEAKVDITKTSKAGELIENMTQRMGARIGATTAETHFKKIPQALTNRAK